MPEVETTGSGFFAKPNRRVSSGASEQPNTSELNEAMRVYGRNLLGTLVVDLVVIVEAHVGDLEDLPASQEIWPAHQFELNAR